MSEETIAPCSSLMSEETIVGIICISIFTSEIYCSTASNRSSCFFAIFLCFPRMLL